MTVAETKIWAHRGAAMEAIENTMEAFQLAIDMGVDGLECDVQRSNDGRLLVFHDEKLKRLTGSKGFVYDQSWKELRSLRLQSKTLCHRGQIPSLEAVLDLVRASKVRLNIELKNSVYPYLGMEAEILAMVKAFGLEDRVVYSSFNHDSIHTLHQLCPEADTALLFSCMPYRPFKYMRKVGANALHLARNSLSLRRLIKKARKRNVPLRFWTVDKPKELSFVQTVFADAVITNDPRLALKIRLDARKLLLPGGRDIVD